MKVTTQNQVDHALLGNPLLQRNFGQKPLSIFFIVLVMLLLILLVGFPRLGAHAE